jgi:hypothetical protein
MYGLRLTAIFLLSSYPSTFDRYLSAQLEVRLHYSMIVTFVARVKRPASVPE